MATIQTKPSPAASAPPGSASTRPRRVRAVVFSNFPGQYFHEKMLPKFLEHNVEVLRVIHMDRSSSQDCTGADIVIAMVDLMAQGQRRTVKEIAKKWGLRFVGLSKRSPWKDYLNIPVHPDTEDRKVVPLHGRSVVKEYKPDELLALDAPPPSDAPEPTAAELQELIEIYEIENRDLLEFKKAFGDTLKAREDNIITLMLENEEVKKASALLEQRLKSQTDIRGELESEVRDAKEALDALARQLEMAKRAPAPNAPGPVVKDPPGTLSATKAHNTRLRNENAVLTTAHKDALEKLRVAEEKLRVFESQPKPTAVAPRDSAPPAKEDIIAWGNAIRDIVTGNPVGYRALLSLAGKYSIDVRELLEQIG